MTGPECLRGLSKKQGWLRDAATKIQKDINAGLIGDRKPVSSQDNKTVETAPDNQAKVKAESESASQQ